MKQIQITIDNETKYFILSKRITTIGSDKSNDIVLSHPTVSRKHLQIMVKDSGVYAMDLGSKNGTCLNYSTMEPSNEVQLHSKLPLQLGKQVEISLLNEAPTLAPQYAYARRRLQKARQSHLGLPKAKAKKDQQMSYELAAAVILLSVTLQYYWDQLMR